jgi:hypothetical protein
MKKILISIFLLSLSSAVFSGDVYTNDQGVTVSVEENSSDSFYVKITGVKTKWENRVFKLKKTVTAGKERYSFDYEVDLSGGKQQRTYTVLAQIGDEIKKDVRYKRLELYFPEGNVNRPVVLRLNPEQSQGMKDKILAPEFKKTPFTPPMD